jgi:hypothetical protein
VNLADGLFVLAAQFESNDGSTFRGYVTPGEQPDDMQPTVVTAAGEQISFWSGIVMPEREEIEDAYRTLAKTPGELFPLQVEALVETANGTLTATIEGFGYYDNSRRARVVT